MWQSTQPRLTIAGSLLINGGWHGHGWGEFGVAWNAAVAAMIVIAAALGVAAGRTDRTD